MILEGFVTKTGYLSQKVLHEEVQFLIRRYKLYGTNRPLHFFKLIFLVSYFPTEKNKLCADSEASTVTSLTECKKVVRQLKKSDKEIRFPMIETEKDWPRGCYLQPHIKYVYLNRDVVGSANALAQQICRGKSMILFVIYSIHKFLH